MSRFGKLFSINSKPIMAKSKYVSIEDIKSTSYMKKTVGSGLSMKPDTYYVVASVELGNTTTKCILTATNLRTSQTYLLDKTVKMTRDIRSPKNGEKVFGETVWEVELTKESVSEMVRDTIHESLKRAHVNIEKDLDFVVRSTGVTAGFASLKEVGDLIIALANGCLEAGIPPRKMAPAMSRDNFPKRLQDYTMIDKIIFDGAVASVLPPTGKAVVANEMEGELVTAGIKIGAKWTKVDFRNPCVSMDFGTTLAGRITNNDEPYARTIGNFCGLAGGISDSIIRGTEMVDKRGGAALDLYKRGIIKGADWKVAKKFAKEAHEYVDIRKVPEGRDRFGTVPVDPKAAYAAGTTLIGCDVGKNGDAIPELTKLGHDIYESEGIHTLFATLDHVSALVVKRLVEEAFDEGVIEDGSMLGVTGRAGITGKKPELILEYVQKYFKNTIFVSDALAMGAAVMARCMNSMGTPNVPIGGRQGGACILGQRRKLQNQK
ncbi:methanogenesis marker 14 protein [Methanobacterium paludis]|uniref:Methanogenesis marker protein 14 n=1 Tax=Methanobacterium paludis (strain DSM 25820 / JCM 18151 / SWAN1) TaxID=868131 RepID=F6D2C4_METPW|nr:methanogenesis marker 14 protein [Methanobacterium paludis]AEG19056.1 methanogenesis marker protein 14 [Methanobacterium paludis]